MSSADIPNCEFTQVSDAETLNALCEQWKNLPFLAIDTEFMRVDTFYPQLALLQINDGSQIYLIDPLEIEDWEAFKRLMCQASVVKIFHSCSEDLLVFAHVFKLLPVPVFDTQIANAFLNEGFGISYQNLVAAHAGHEIPKGETRSDWLQRPLSQQQLDYAALDVEYLPAIYRRQVERLEQQDRLAWVQEDCQRLLGNYREELEQDFSQAYTGFSAAWQLDGNELVLLKLLAEWRERRARERDKPKNWILRDHAILEIAKTHPASRGQLQRVDGLNSNFIHYESEAILALVREAETQPAMSNHFPRPLTNSQKKLFNQAQALVRRKAEELALPVEILGRKRLLLSVFYEVLAHKLDNQSKIDPQSLALPEEFSGWRQQYLLYELLELLQ